MAASDGAMTNLPVIGTLNTVFVVTITIGMGLILLTMIFHMINSLREKKARRSTV